MLLQSISPRLEFIRYSNNIQNETSYDDILRVGAELIKVCRDNKAFILRVNQLREPQDKVTQFNINMADFSIRLVLLLLHRPFASKGMKDPRFYYSRKICLESALTILNYPSSEYAPINQAPDNMLRDDYAQFKVVSGNFKSIIIYMGTIIFHEIHTQLEEEGPAIARETNDSRETLKQSLRDLRDLAENRVIMGENNIMIRLFLSITLALIGAIEEGSDPETVALDAARKNSQFCYDLMIARTPEASGSLPVETGAPDMLSGFGGPLDFGMDFTVDGLDDQEFQKSWFQFACNDGMVWS